MSMRRIAAASMVGTTLEYFDFAVYNSLAALVFNRIFFPSFDPLAGTILAFATFAVGYLARPFGGALFGRLGDRRGRRHVLVTTLLLMGVTTVSIGLLPSYSQVGLVSPLLLVLLRFVQGMALGGEWAGAVLLSLEHGSADHRGRNGAWAQIGPALGTLLATGLIALITMTMPAEAFQFLSGCPIVADTIYGHRHSALPLERHFLHAARLTITLPDEAKPRVFEAPLPPDLSAVLDELRAKFR